MSAVRIAVGDADTRVFGADDAASAKDKLLGFLGKVTKWIPADVMAIYGAAIIAMQPKSADGTATTPVVSVELWVIFLIATPIVVFLLGWVAGSDRLVRRVLLSIPAFIIWTASIPHSAWAKLGVFNDTATAVIALAVLALVAAVFAPVADKLVGES